MNKFSTFEFQASIETLRDAASTGTIPQDLLEPLQSLLTPLIEDLVRRPAGVYLFSADREKELRDLFGFCLARALLPHAKTTLLVDCDFLGPGLSGIVPQRDSLGFLDLLLYGSSMKAIVQKSMGGAFVVGAGSFQVTKKLPFSMESFRTAARYLLNHTRCAIFSGPAEDDAGELHPMAGAFESVLCVRAAGATGDVPFSRFLEKLAALEESNIFVVNIVQPQRKPVIEERTAPEAAESKAPEETAAEPAREPERVFPVGAAKEPTKEPPVGATKQPAKEPTNATGAMRAAAAERRVEYLRQKSRDSARWDEVEEGITGETKNSLLPKVVTSIVAVILVAFVFWWLFLTKSVREGEMEQVDREVPKTVAQSGAADSGAVPQRPETTAAEPEVRPEELAAGAAIDTARARTPVEETASPPPATVTPQQPVGRIELYTDLMPMVGKYLIHISSFRALLHAEDDARYLKENGYSVFVALVDLGGKGAWYRVYVGPLETREEARQVKLNVETLSRVKFARILTVPE